MNYELILAENLRRRQARERPFDPVTGLNSTGHRFLFSVPDYILPEQYLPNPMLSDPLILALRKAGSITDLSQDTGEDPDHIAERFLRLRMRHDFPFWAATAVNIKAKGGGDDVRFILNAPQRRLVECFERERLVGRPIRIILLKARQWGGSTCAQLYMAWLQLFHKVGLNSLIIAHQGAGSDEIKDMFDRMIAAYPPEFLYDIDDPELISGRALRRKKMIGVGKSGAIFRIPARNCKVKIGTAERPDSCRGGDYNLVHLSEVGIWKTTDGKSPEDIVRSACGGVLLAPLTMIVYESTANGTGNFFHTEFQAAMRGESQFKPMFVSWFEIEQYSLPLTPDEERDMAENLFANKDSLASTDRSESGRYLWKLFEAGASLEAIKWYVAERAKYNDHADMAAEYPSDHIEAFAHSGARVFDRYDVERLAEHCRDPRYRGSIVSPHPDGPDCLRSLEFRQSRGGELEVWLLPGEEAHGQSDNGHDHDYGQGYGNGRGNEVRILNRYLTVVDVGGRSVKADWSVVVVLDRAPLLRGEPPEIAAQWRGHCDIDVLAWQAARIAMFYGESLLVIESNTLETRDRDRMLEGNQTPYILQQLEEAYPNLYMRGGTNPRPGFHTNSATKPMLISTLVRGIREGSFVERSAAAIDEYLSYERKPNGSFGAIKGAHDDLLMTRAIALHISQAEMDPPRIKEGMRPPNPLKGAQRNRFCDF